MSEKTYSAREIVLSLFPDTDETLIPLPEPYRFELADGGTFTPAARRHRSRPARAGRAGRQRLDAALL